MKSEKDRGRLGLKSEWVTESLKNVISYIAKGIPPAYVDTDGENTVRVLNQKCNRDFAINYANSRCHNLDKRKVPTEKYLRDDDILINSTGTGTAGRIAQLNNVPYPTIVDGHMIVIRSNEKVISRYLGYALKAKQSAILQLDEGSTGQTELNRDRLLSEIEVSYPLSLEEQESIALTFSAIDARIATNKAINHHLEQIAQAIFKSWFVNFEPWGGTVPSKWKDTTLGDLCTLISKGITPKYDDSSDQIVVNQRCIRNRSIDFSLARRHKPKVINEKWLHYGDVLINSTGEGTLGRAAQFLLNADNITADSHVTIIRPSSEELFAYIGLWCLSHEALFASMSSGSTGQTDLPREQLKLLDVMRPDIETLWNFSSTVAPLIKKRIECIRESAQLASLRDTLLPRLMSGEVSVTDLTAK